MPPRQPIEPMNPPSGLSTNGKKAGAIGAVATMIGVPLALIFGQVLDRGEGDRLHSYRDSVGIWTVCRGVIRNADGSPIRANQHFTPAECQQLNDAEAAAHLRMALDAAPILKQGCQVAGGTQCRWPGPLLAAGSLTYNIGGGNYRNSSVVRYFRAGDFYHGCVAFALWNRAGGRVIPGLAFRRAWEQSDLCFVGIPIPAGVHVPPPSRDGQAWARQLRAMGASAQ